MISFFENAKSLWPSLIRKVYDCCKFVIKSSYTFLDGTSLSKIIFSKIFNEMLYSSISTE